jgi:hypothetical protein
MSGLIYTLIPFFSLSASHSGTIKLHLRSVPKRAGKAVLPDLFSQCSHSLFLVIFSNYHLMYMNCLHLD